MNEIISNYYIVYIMKVNTVQRKIRIDIRSLLLLVLLLSLNNNIVGYGFYYKKIYNNNKIMVV
jgi:hypothetical protein